MPYLWFKWRLLDLHSWSWATSWGTSWGTAYLYSWLPYARLILWFFSCASLQTLPNFLHFLPQRHSMSFLQPFIYPHKRSLLMRHCPRLLPEPLKQHMQPLRKHPQLQSWSQISSKLLNMCSKWNRSSRIRVFGMLRRLLRFWRSMPKLPSWLQPVQCFQ